MLRMGTICTTVWTKKETSMKNWDMPLAAALLLSLAACAPKRYERKHSPVGASSVEKSSDKAQEKKQTEEAEVR